MDIKPTIDKRVHPGGAFIPSPTDIRSVPSNDSKTGIQVRNTIRPFEPDDITKVAKLTQVYFPKSRLVSADCLANYFSNLYFSDPLYNSLFPSLVYISGSGNINGFLGVVAKPYLYRGKQITVAHCNHLMVSEQGSSDLAQIRMLQKFVAGSQDLSFVNRSVDITRLLWERAGGITSGVNSIYYKISLRPVSFAVAPVRTRLPAPANRFLETFASGLDSLGETLQIPFFFQPYSTRTAPLIPELLIQGLGLISRHHILFPKFNHATVLQQFHHLDHERRNGRLFKAAMFDEQENLSGWFIYCMDKLNHCEVIQAVSLPGFETRLFHTLCSHAFRQGGIVLLGKLSPGHFRTPFTTRSISMPGWRWTLLHSPNQDLLIDIQSGQNFLISPEGNCWFT